MTSPSPKASLAKQVANVIREHVAKAFGVLRADIEALKLRNAEQARRIEALERKQKEDAR
jgi:hypothetical protein